jgi:hypothetical protein
MQNQVLSSVFRSIAIEFKDLKNNKLTIPQSALETEFLMPQLRQDRTTKEWVIIATDRWKRPLNS